MPTPADLDAAVSASALDQNAANVEWSRIQVQLGLRDAPRPVRPDLKAEAKKGAPATPPLPTYSMSDLVRLATDLASKRAKHRANIATRAAWYAAQNAVKK